jgi:3-(3-hydroxy-phenyl)propionate hydroxylase
VPPPTSTTELPPSVGAFHYTRYKVCTPPLEAGGIEPGCHPVVIAGGGPVGMALALGLANHDVRCVVLEADDTVCVGSRAACISRRSLEIMARLGVRRSFMAKGLPWTGGRSFYKTAEVFRFEMPHDAQQKLPPMINLEQYYAEHYLLEEIFRRNEATPGLIDIRWGTELTGLVQDDEGVTLDVRNAEGGYRLQGQWLAACDGGQSFVRKALALLARRHGLRRPLRDHRHRAAQRPCDRAPRVVRPTVEPGLDRADAPPARRYLAHRLPAARRAEHRRGAATGGRGRVRAAPSRCDRRGASAVEDGVDFGVSRGGDDARELPPRPRRCSLAMRRMRCRSSACAVSIRASTMRTTSRGSWRWLRAACSDAALLDSYSHERIAAFHVNAENAMRSTEFMSPPSRGFDLLREAALSLSEVHRGIAQLINPRQTQAVRYADSALSSGSDALPAGPLPGEAMTRAAARTRPSHRLDRAGLHAAGAASEGRCCTVA